jgi:hypothetical protein
MSSNWQPGWQPDGRTSWWLGCCMVLLLALALVAAAATIGSMR